MTLTVEDVGAIKVALKEEVKPMFTEIKTDISDLAHLSNKRFTAIELRLDAIEYKLQQIAVFVPYENAFLLPPKKKRATD